MVRSSFYNKLKLISTTISCFEIKIIFLISNYKIKKMKNYFYLIAFFISGFVFAQEDTGPELWITYEYTVKAGMNQNLRTLLQKNKTI